ncbi:ammonium transporter, partial [Streptococcus pyogenes]
MNTGSIAFMIVSSALLFFMTPGLAFFYGGLGRRKNVISTMMMSFVPIGIAVLMWVVLGYSLSFSGEHLLVGNLGAFLMNGV